MGYQTIIDGQCHCGNISYAFKSNRAIADIPLRKCNCTFCSKHNCVYSADANGEFEYKEAARKTNRYQFGHSTAVFHVCKTCGMMPFVTCEIDGQEYAVVNLCTATSHAFSNAPTSTKDFSGESVDDRLARRKQTWMPTVKTKSNR